jgi:YebC/PmpR family DNA-binding regulatory protein
MSGHSKWARIKRKKGVADVKRGQVFTKIGRIITLAAHEGGDDPETNFKLRLAIQKAKEVNMPKDSIDRAVKRGTGKLEGQKIEKVSYEAFGPSGIALIIEVLTDNRNRVVSEIRNILSQHGGSMSKGGSFSWMFKQKGLIRVEGTGEEIELKIIDTGAEDFQEEGGEILVYTKPNDLFNIRKKLEEQGVKVISAELSLEPKKTIKITDKKTTLVILKLMETLENCDDVVKVYSNFDIEERIMETLA